MRNSFKNYPKQKKYTYFFLAKPILFFGVTQKRTNENTLNFHNIFILAFIILYYIQNILTISKIFLKIITILNLIKPKTIYI